MVTPGDQTNRQNTVEQKLQLSPAMKVQPGTLQEYDFSLPIPTRGCPTHESSKTRVTWELAGIIDRAMRDDTNVAQELYLFTTPGRAEG